MQQSLNNTFLGQMRQEADPLADRAIESIFNSPNASSFRSLMQADVPNDHPVPEGLPEAAHLFYEQFSQLPSGTNKKRLARAAVFFSKHASEIMGLLGSLSLPYCYAAAEGAKVLYLSERIRRDTYQRLMETGRFVLEVMDENAFEPTGHGLTAIRKVRLVHAAIRFHIAKSGEWDAALGKPINQEDMAGTNLAFSLIIIRGLRKTGVDISTQEASDYLYAWQVIGKLLGVRDELNDFENAKQAHMLASLIEKRHFKPSKEGKVLIQSLIGAFGEGEGPQALLPQGYITSYMRYLLGRKTADLLDIPPANWPTSIFQSVQVANRIGKAFGGQWGFNRQNVKAARNMTYAMGKEKPVITIPDKLKNNG